MTQDVWLTELYFDWLKNEAFSIKEERRVYEGVLRELHDIPFVWTLWPDENRAGDALAFRQADFLSLQRDLDALDQVWLANWATAAPSVLEVLLGMARRWSFYFGGDVHFYFANHLFSNMEFNRYPGVVISGQAKRAIRARVDVWLSRNFEKDGVGSPFPCTQAFNIVDMRELDMWTQMNAYSAEHFQ